MIDMLKERRTLTALLLALLTILAGIAYGLSTTEPPVLVLFIGRFHPLVVHLPIGILVVAVLMEAAAQFGNMKRLRSANFFVLICAAVSAVLAVVAGLFLAREGGYDEQALFWHRWLGIGVAVGSAAAAFLEERSRGERTRGWRRAYQGVLAGTAGLLVLTGHLGGTLTHGPTYLTRHMPAPLASLVGLDAADPGAGQGFVHVDSARVYADLVQPVLEQRCSSCHNASKTKGGLRLDTPEHLMEGGDGGPVVSPGNPDQSELLRRVTLPLYHEDRMPPEGEEPLEVGQTELIRWWIAEGASLDQQVAQTETRPPAVETMLTRLSRPQEEVKTGIYALEVDPPDSTAVKHLRESGLSVRSVGQDTPFLQVATMNVAATFDDEDLAPLLEVGEQVAWLDLSETQVTDAGMETVGELPHLTRLHLQNTDVGDTGLEQLANLEHLEYLNLYGTDVSDAAVEHLAALEGLKAVYLWQTSVSQEAAARLQQRRPNLTVDTGSPLLPPDSTIQTASAVDEDEDAS